MRQKGAGQSIHNAGARDIVEQLLSCVRGARSMGLRWTTLAAFVLQYLLYKCTHRKMPATGFRATGDTHTHGVWREKLVWRCFAIACSLPFWRTCCVCLITAKFIAYIWCVAPERVWSVPAYALVAASDLAYISDNMMGSSARRRCGSV